MSSITIEHPITGKAWVIENPLRAEHVRKGLILWYSGFTSQFRWNCPAEIVEVDKKNRRFRVKSLDDGRKQHQWYDFDLKKDAPASRQTMRIPTNEDVEEFRRTGTSPPW